MVVPIKEVPSKGDSGEGPPMVKISPSRKNKYKCMRIYEEQVRECTYLWGFARTPFIVEPQE